MKKTIQTIYLLLLLGVMALPLRAQSPEFENIPLGWRVKIDHPVTVYGDYLGSPNPYDRYTLNARYFFQLIGTQTPGCHPLPSESFTKILIPGTPDTAHQKMGSLVENPNFLQGKLAIENYLYGGKAGDSTKLNQLSMLLLEFAKQLAEEENPEICGCPDAFPRGNSQEKQIQNTEKGRTFWIKTSELTASGFSKDVSTAVEDNHVNTQRFDQAKLYSRTFVSVLAVPFKYRFSYKKGGETILTGESSIGPCLGYRIVKSNFFDQNLWVMGSAGITFINPNLLLSDSTASKLKTEPGVTACIGIGGNVGTTQFGIVHGWDFTDKSWAFHRKPWIAFSVGVALVKRDAKSANQ